MKNSKGHILLIDSHREELTQREAALRCIYDGDVLTGSEAREGIELINTENLPEMILMPFSALEENEAAFYRHLDSEKIKVPLFVFTEEEMDENLSKYFPLVTSFLPRPKDSKRFSEFVQALIRRPQEKRDYVPIKIPVLLKLGMGLFDLFLKLSDKNYVRIIHKGEPFLEADANKLYAKGVYELFIKAEDSEEFLLYLENDKLNSGANSLEDISRTLDNLETFEKVAKTMGWPTETMQSAKKSVAEAVKILSKNSDIFGAIRLRLTDPTSSYSRHIGLLAYLVTAFGSNLGWIGESGQVKLALAAMIHDVAVDESYYENIQEWNKRAGDLSDKSPETIRYRMHPFEASKLVRGLESFSSDVDQIILQHHEVKDGSGFPRGLDSHRIGHLPALFIIVEDFIDFMERGTSVETSVVDFMTWGREQYNSGQFKKIYQAIESKLQF